MFRYAEDDSFEERGVAPRADITLSLGAKVTALAV
jgi:hypothetical protein